MNVDFSFLGKPVFWSAMGVLIALRGVSSRGTESWDRSQLFHKLTVTQVATYAF
jgi:hypothetical protein